MAPLLESAPDEDDYLISQAMRSMTNARLATAARPRSSPGRSPAPTLGRTQSTLTDSHQPSPTTGLQRSQSNVAGARLSGPPPVDSLERLWQGGTTLSKSAGEPTPASATTFAPPPDMVFLENDLAMALSCVLREKTVPKLCSALAQAVRAYVLPKWANHVHVLLHESSGEGGDILLVEQGADDATVAEAGRWRPRKKKPANPPLRLPTDRGLAAAAARLPVPTPLLVACPATAHEAFDLEVDTPLFGVEAGSGLLAVPLVVNGRRLGAVLALGSGMPCGSDVRRRMLVGSCWVRTKVASILGYPLHTLVATCTRTRV